MKLGARIIKTGISVVLAIYIGKLLGLESFTFSAVAAVIAVQPSVYRSVNHMAEQLQGNLIGAVFAIIGLSVLGKEPLVIGLVVVFVILLNLKLKLDGSVVLSSITVISIMATTNEHSILFALDRFSSIMIGVFTAILLNIVFMPPKYEKNLLEQIKKVNQSVSFLLRNVNDEELAEKAYKEIKDKAECDIEKAKTMYALYKEEFDNKIRVKKVGYKEVKKLVVYKHILSCISMQIHSISLLEKNILLNENVPKDLTDGVGNHIDVLVNYFEKIIMKYENKFKPHDKHERMEEIFINNKELLKELINPKMSTNLDEDVWIDLFPVVSSLIELSSELDKLDKLVNNFQLHQ